MHFTTTNKLGSSKGGGTGAEQAERRARRTIVDAVLNAGLHKHQRLALLNALTDRRLRGIVSSLGINPEETKVATHILKNMRSVLMRARMKSNRHAKVTKAR